MNCLEIDWDKLMPVNDFERKFSHNSILKCPWTKSGDFMLSFIVL